MEPRGWSAWWLWPRPSEVPVPELAADGDFFVRSRPGTVRLGPDGVVFALGWRFIQVSSSGIRGWWFKPFSQRSPG